MTKGPADDFCSVAEAAALLKVSHSTIWRWIAAGKLSAYRIGPRSIRIKREALQAVVQPARATEEEGTAMKEDNPAHTPSTLQPLSEEEVMRGLAALKQAQVLGERMLARRHGQPLPASWEEIRQARQERSERL